VSGALLLAGLAAGCSRGPAEPEGAPAPSAAAAVQRPGEVSPAEARDLDLLHDVGYAGAVQAADDRAGVTVLRPDLAQAGLNFYCGAGAPEARLMDMQGEVLHVWRCEFRSIWPDVQVTHEPDTQWFRRAFLCENGDVLAIFEGLGVVRLDEDSRVLWAALNGAHHDLAVRPDGQVWVLTRKWMRTAAPEPTLFDFITVLDAEGREVRSVPLFDCLQKSQYRSIFLGSPFQTGDVFHTNTLHVLTDAAAERAPAFQPGRVLTSFRMLNALAIVDLDQEKVVWAYQGDFRQQHDPQLLPNGNVLFFDNLGRHPYSRILEFDPVTLKTVWSYAGSAERPFYSFRCGTVQRLANGNTLITESEAGRAFEVLPDGTTVWEFVNPARMGEHDELVARLFDMRRLPRDFPVEWTDDRR